MASAPAAISAYDDYEEEEEEEEEEDYDDDDDENDDDDDEDYNADDDGYLLITSTLACAGRTTLPAMISMPRHMSLTRLMYSIWRSQSPFWASRTRISQPAWVR